MVSTLTTSPISTASSTSAVISRGVDTATSTPQESSKSHSLRGLFTRPTVRGTPNSERAISETTRFTRSSPVAATTTSVSSSPASASTRRSQASPTLQLAPGASTRPTASGFSSMIRTS